MTTTVLWILYALVAVPATFYYLVQAVKWEPYWREMENAGRKLPTQFEFDMVIWIWLRVGFALGWPLTAGWLLLRAMWRTFVLAVHVHYPTPPLPPAPPKRG